MCVCVCVCVCFNIYFSPCVRPLPTDSSAYPVVVWRSVRAAVFAIEPARHDVHVLRREQEYGQVKGSDGERKGERESVCV